MARVLDARRRPSRTIPSMIVACAGLVTPRSGAVAGNYIIEVEMPASIMAVRMCFLN